MIDLAWLLLLLPLLAAVTLVVLGRRAPEGTVLIALGTQIFSFCLVLGLAWQIIPLPEPLPWLEMKDLSLSLGLVVDPISLVLLLLVTGLMLLLQIQLLARLPASETDWRFWTFSPGFLFAVTGFLLVDNLLGLLCFGQMLAILSYLLVAQSDAQPGAQRNAQRCLHQFLLCEGFLVFGILSGWWGLSAHTFSTHPVALFQPQSQTTLWISAPLFLSVLALAGLMPFHRWVQDFTAVLTVHERLLLQGVVLMPMGIYLLLRVYSYLVLSPDVLRAGAWLCGFSALGGALLSLRCPQFPERLAWLATSQMGVIGLAIGLGHPTLGLIHLLGFCLALPLLSLGLSLLEEKSLNASDRKWLLYPLGFGLLSMFGVVPWVGLMSGEGLAQELEVDHPFAWFFLAGLKFLLSLNVLQIASKIGVLWKSRSAQAETLEPTRWKLIFLPLFFLAGLHFVLGWWPIVHNGLHPYLHQAMQAILSSSGQLSSFHGEIPGTESSVWFTWTPLLALFLAVLIHSFFPTASWEKKNDKPLFNLGLVHGRSAAGEQRKPSRFLAWLDAWVLDSFLIRGTAFFGVALGEVLRLWQSGSLRAYLFFTLLAILLMLAWVGGAR